MTKFSTVLLFWGAGLLFPLLSLAQVTNAQKFQWLEQDSPERQEFIRKSNRELNAHLKQSPNRAKIEKEFRTLFSKSHIRGQVQIKDEIHQITYLGLGKGTELALI